MNQTERRERFEDALVNGVHGPCDMDRILDWYDADLQFVQDEAVQVERDHIREAINKILADHFEPCSCIEAYISRKLIDPQCHYCFYFPELKDELLLATKEALTKEKS